jgi:RNA polymerase sigma factor (sigma-70 family)
LTDEVFDRVGKKVREVRPTYVGDPRLYFRAVARNLIKENFKKTKTHLSFDEVDLSLQQMTETEEDIVGMEECLQSCLRELRADKLELILGYYAKQKRANIDHRNELARRLEISVETLRVRVFRIRASLERCIERCLQSKAQRK